jgi:hypothetical protein
MVQEVERDVDQGTDASGEVRVVWCPKSLSLRSPSQSLFHLQLGQQQSPQTEEGRAGPHGIRQTLSTCEVEVDVSFDMILTLIKSCSQKAPRLVGEATSWCDTWVRNWDQKPDRPGFWLSHHSTV